MIYFGEFARFSSWVYCITSRDFGRTFISRQFFLFHQLLLQDKILDKNDDFSDFRLRAAELVRDTVYLVGSTECFAHLFSLLSSNESMATWDVTEATLFVMSAIAKHVDT